jgi:manganese/zinc/iron transport system substrate-binding protein
MMMDIGRPIMNRTLFLILLGSALLVGCDGGGGANPVSGGGPDAYPYKVTTTVGMITDIVRHVAGDKAEVTGIMREGVDPHLYKPTVSDIAKLQSADVVFYNGLMLEGKMGDVLVKVAKKTGQVHAVTELLDDERFVMEDQLQHFDPHVWMDVQGWMLAVQAVAKALGEYDPAHADFYKANADAYIVELEALDAYVKQVIGSIPRQQRVLVTAHDAFQYFGRAYDIEVRGIQGISTESEAGLKDINDLVAFLVERNIPAVFFETSVADKNVRSLVEGAKANGHNVRIGGSLFSDAMGGPGTYEGTYIGMIDHNATLIARALGGEAPERGMNGKLNIED